LNHGRSRNALTHAATFEFVAPFIRIVNRAPSAATTSTTASLPVGASLKAANGAEPLSSMKSGPLTDAARALVRLTTRADPLVRIRRFSPPQFTLSARATRPIPSLRANPLASFHSASGIGRVPGRVCRQASILR
jgi:hypothetical protein